MHYPGEPAAPPPAPEGPALNAPAPGAPPISVATRAVLDYGRPDRRWPRLARWLPRLSKTTLALLLLAAAATWWAHKTSDPWRPEQQFAGWIPDVEHAVSPNGRSVLAGTAATRTWHNRSGRPRSQTVATDLSACDLQTGQKRWTYVGPGDVSGAVWSPDGERVVMWYGHRDGRLLDSRTGREVLRSVADAAVFGPDGSFLVAGDAAHRSEALGQVSLRRSTDGAVIAVLVEDGYLLNHQVLFSPDGTRMMFHCRRREVPPGARPGVYMETPYTDVWDLRPPARVASVLWRDGSATRAAEAKADLAKLGFPLATGSDEFPKVRLPGGDTVDDSRQLITVESQATGRRAPLLPHANLATSPPLSPDGTRLLGTTRPSAVVWDARTLKPVGSANVGGDDYTPAAWSPDSARVLFRISSDRVELWDRDLSRRLAVLRGRPNQSDLALARWVDPSRFLTVGQGGGVTVWRRVRPEPWWGLAARWEFWLAALVTITALYRLACDLRRWYSPRPATNSLQLGKRNRNSQLPTPNAQLAPTSPASSRLRP